MSEPGWVVDWFEETREAHVIREDLRPDHHATRACPCQPRIEEDIGLDGRPAWMVVHAGGERVS